MNKMEICGREAFVQYDPEIKMFRGAFLELTGGADFYADTMEQLKKEGAISLQLYLDICKEKGREPFKRDSGKFNVRIASDLHARLA